MLIVLKQFKDTNYNYRLTQSKRELCIKFTDLETKQIKRWHYDNNAENLKLCKSFLLKQELKHLKHCIDNKVFH